MASILPDNERRADSAEVACKAFARAYNLDYDSDFDSVVIDLITNIMHLCDRYAMDPFRPVRIAQDHFVVEAGGDE
jgi:hypothetical protein